MLYRTKNVCGRYDRYPLSHFGIEGGKRTNQQKERETSAGQPLISYITVVRNGRDTLLRCMKSIWSQDYPEIEYIIIDGASTDGTLELIQQHADKIDYFISEPDEGTYHAMNKGISLARGDFLCFINCDDEVLPHAAGIVSRCYQKTGSLLLAGRRLLRLTNDAIVEEAAYLRLAYPMAVLRHNRLWHQSLYAHKDAFEQIGSLPEEYPIIADFVWSRQCVDAGLPVCFLEENLSCFFWGGISSTQPDRLVHEMACQIQEVFPFVTEKDAGRICRWLDAHQFSEYVSLKHLVYLWLRYGWHRLFRQTLWMSILLAEADELHQIMRETVVDQSRPKLVIPGLQGETIEENYRCLCDGLEDDCRRGKRPALRDFLFAFRLKIALDRIDPKRQPQIN